MNKVNQKIKTLTASFLAVAVLGTTGLVMAEGNPLGAKAAAADDNYTLQEMLTYAIQDEYLAKAEYAAIIDTFDVTRPYTNIIRAESNHIAELLPLFDNYKVPVPVESSVAGQAVIPATLTETFAIGVEAEKNNIAMYEAFLKQDLPDDVRVVFENLRDGSIKHLAAFERGVERDGATAGSGAGNGAGVGVGSRGNRGNNGNRNTLNGQPGIGFSGNTDRDTASSWGNRGNRGTGLGLQGDPENCILN